MLSHPHTAPRRGPLYLCLTLIGLLLMVLYLPTPASQLSLHELPLLRTAPDPADRIELTLAQESELAAAYADGFRNPNPDDPCGRIKMLPYKQLSKWKRQFSQRGFTLQTVRELLLNGRRVAYTHPTKGTEFTRIIGSDGKSVVVDFADCVLWQIAPANFKF